MSGGSFEYLYNQPDVLFDLDRYTRCLIEMTEYAQGIEDGTHAEYAYSRPEMWKGVGEALGTYMDEHLERVTAIHEAHERISDLMRAVEWKVSGDGADLRRALKEYHEKPVPAAPMAEAYTLMAMSNMALIQEANILRAQLNETRHKDVLATVTQGSGGNAFSITFTDDEGAKDGAGDKQTGD